MKTTSNERRLQISQMIYLSNHWSDLSQICNLSLCDQTKPNFTIIAIIQAARIGGSGSDPSAVSMADNSNNIGCQDWVVWL